MSNHARTVNTNCCTKMTEMVTFVCGQHPDRFQCPDALIHFSQRSCEYGIIVHDGGSSFVSIAFCPWCGASLVRHPNTETDLVNP